MSDKTWVNRILMGTILGTFCILDGKIERQGTRPDRLYEMYVDTQKEIAQLRIDWLSSK